MLIELLKIIIIHKYTQLILQYDTIKWTDSTYETIINIADYIYEDYIKGEHDGLCFLVSFIII